MDRQDKYPKYCQNEECLEGSPLSENGKCKLCKTQHTPTRDPNLGRSGVDTTKHRPIPLLKNISNQVEIEASRQYARQIVKTISEAQKYDADNVATYIPEGIEINARLYDINHTINSNIKKLEKLKAQKKGMGKKPQGSIAYWITICPPHPYDNIQSAVLIMEKLSATSLMTNNPGVYSYEWRQPELNEGCHIHLLIHRDDNQSPNKALRPLYNQLQDFGVGQGPSIELKYVYNKQALKNVENYVRGIKIDPLKMDKVDMDKKFRLEWDLEDFYEF